MQANGYLLPAKESTNHPPAQSGAGRGSDEKAKPSNRVRLNGNIVRRKPGKRIREYWDIDLPGFGLRVNPGGRRTWFVLFRQRGKLRRVSLGTSRDISPATAQRCADWHKHLACHDRRDRCAGWIGHPVDRERADRQDQEGAVEGIAGSTSGKPDPEDRFEGPLNLGICCRKTEQLEGSGLRFQPCHREISGIARSDQGDHDRGEQSRGLHVEDQGDRRQD